MMAMNGLINKYLFYNAALLMKGEFFYNELHMLQKSQFFPHDKIQQIQNEKLKKIVAYAKKHSPYYQDILPSKIDVSELRTINLLDKTTVRHFSRQMLTSKSFFCREKTTGGTTGAAVTLYKNPRAMRSELAAAWRGYGWAGVGIGDKQARFWGTPQNSARDKIRAGLIDFVCNRLRIAAFGVDSNHWDDALNKIKQFKPDYFYGYVSMIKEFAQHIDEKRKVGVVRPKAIVTTAEVLEKEDRDFISNIFDAPVFNEYGCGEVNTIAHECQLGKLHVNAENLIVEIVNELGIPVPPGNEGEIVVTDLNNAAMPLIRYRLADWGSLSTEACPCGRSLPVIRNIYGRAYDSLLNSKGKKFHGSFCSYIIGDAKKKGLPADGVQFVQESDGRIVVKIICKQNIIDPLSKHIVKRLADSFDNNFPITIERVEHIEREKSGKMRFVKREFRGIN